MIRPLLRRFFHKAYRLCLPRYFSPDADDVYLVSYPRSGNTWVRVIVSEMLYGESGSSLRELQHYVPDLYVKTRVDELVAADRHVVKTHATFDQDCRRAIYIIRDPRDVILSYYRYQAQLGKYEFGFDQFVSDWVNGRVFPCSWPEHVNSWTKDVRHRYLDLLIVRYEDLLRETGAQIARIARYLGCQLASSDIDRIVASSSVDEMRRKERRGMPDSEADTDLAFIGPATSKQWLQGLSDAQADYIVSSFHDIMVRFGYLEEPWTVQA